MSLLPKKFNAPVAKPMTPFFIAGAVILYGINSFASVLMSSDEFKNDPRNPNFKGKKPEAH